MDTPNDEIIFVTEASDKSIHLTRTCIYTFTKENPWFDGKIVLLSHTAAKLSTKSLNQLISIYPKIEIKLCTNDPVLDYIISNNTRFKNTPEFILDLLKISLFGIKNKILYSSRYNVFLKPISPILVEDSIAFHYSGLSIFYKDSSIIFDENQVLDIVSNIPAPITISGIESTLMSFIEENEIGSIIPEHYNLQSTAISDKKYNILASKVKAATIIYFNSIKNNSLQYSKIGRLWQFMNKSSTRLINRPVNYTNREVANLRKSAIRRAESNRRAKPAHLRLNMPFAPKLGATYIVFDGIELLESAINSIRANVDFISVIYQNTSWFGAKIKSEDLATLNDLKKRGLIDSLVLFNAFTPLLGKSTKKKIATAKNYETAKRDFSLNDCLRNGCTHYICLDVDEFYDPDQFKKAKDYIYDQNIHYSACKYLNYVTPQLHRGLSAMYVPFICRISKNSKNGKRFFVRTDPTRGVFTHYARKTASFNSSELIMHHMETVRRDIYRKYESTTRLNLDRSKLNELSYIIDSVQTGQSNISFNKIIYAASKDFKLTKTENKFKIPYTEW